MKALKIFLILLVIIFIGIQFVPRHMPENKEADQNDLLTGDTVPASIASILKTSCYDCHSNQTQFPWYAHVAPASWLLADDINEGRRDLNFSEWGTFTKRHKIGTLRKIRQQVSEGNMPLKNYLYIHRDAKLSSAQIDSLGQWTKDMTKQILH
jgi:hypothetical protein